MATASRNGDVVRDAKGSEVVGFKAAHGLTTYWKGQPLKRKAQSEQGDERPAKKQKQKQKKQHRRFTEPVAEPHEYNEGVQNYLEALEVEKNKALSKSMQTLYPSLAAPLTITAATLKFSKRNCNP